MCIRSAFGREPRSLFIKGLGEMGTFELFGGPRFTTGHFRQVGYRLR